MENIKEEVSLIIDKISNLNIKLNSIQSICKHPEESIKVENLNQTGSGPVVLRRVCTDCQKVIGYPSNKELEDWLK